jgi:hypothetical protein
MNTEPQVTTRLLAYNEKFETPDGHILEASTYNVYPPGTSHLSKVYTLDISYVSTADPVVQNKSISIPFTEDLEKFFRKVTDEVTKQAIRIREEGRTPPHFDASAPISENLTFGAEIRGDVNPIYYLSITGSEGPLKIVLGDIEKVGTLRRYIHDMFTT